VVGGQETVRNKIALLVTILWGIRAHGGTAEQHDSCNKRDCQPAERKAGHCSKGVHPLISRTGSKRRTFRTASGGHQRDVASVCPGSFLAGAAWFKFVTH
jgi:hypothetical protein